MAFDKKAYQREYARKYREKHPEKSREICRKWRAKNPEKQKAATYSWRERNREALKEYGRKWYAENNDHLLAKKKEDYEKNKVPKLARDKKFYFKRKYGLEKEQYEELLSIASGKCQACNRPFGKDGPHIDHCHNTGVIRGVLCHGCNTAEGHLGTPENVLKLYNYMMKNELFYQGKS
jgi:Recombination endonuclease VII